MPTNASNRTGTLASATTGASFAPDPTKTFQASLYGTFVGTFVIQVTFDSANWITASTDGTGTAASYTAPVTVIINEPVDGALYRWNCTAYTSGTATWRFDQRL